MSLLFPPVLLVHLGHGALNLGTGPRLSASLLLPPHFLQTLTWKSLSQHQRGGLVLPSMTPLSLDGELGGVYVFCLL